MRIFWLWLRNLMPGAGTWLLIAAVVPLLFFAFQHIEQRGYDRRDAEVQVERLQIAQDHQRILRENIADAQAREQSMRQQVERANAVARNRSSQLAQHLKAQEQQHLETSHADHTSNTDTNPPTTEAAQSNQQDRPLLGAAVLDAHTVRVLNDARAGHAPHAGGAPAGVDEKGRATAVTGTDLALNDLEVVRLYHELAARHSGLVDWVNHQCINPAQTP